MEPFKEFSSLPAPAATTKVPFEEALSKTGFGLYSYCVSLLSAALVIAMVFSAYNISVIIPASACELGTTLEQQGIIAIMPLIGTFATPFLWGYLADTKGRKVILMVSMVLSCIFCSLSAFSPNWIVLMIFMLLSASSVSGAYAISFTFLSESIPMANRSPVMLLVSSIFLLSQGLMAVLAIPIIPLNFAYYIGFLNIYFNSWRFLLIIYALPSGICALVLTWFYESPKFLFSIGDEEGALRALRGIYAVNNRNSLNEYEVEALLLEPSPEQTRDKSLDSKWTSIVNQFIPLFKPPLVKNFALATIMFVIIYSSCNSFMVWLPTVANNFINTVQEGGSEGMTMCQVLLYEPDTIPDPDANPCALNNLALLFVFAIGILQSIVNGLTSIIVNRVGRRYIIIGLHVVAGISGICVNFSTDTIGSLALFILFLMPVLSIGLLTGVCISLFPTNLRAMALSIALLAARVSSTATTSLINRMLAGACQEAFYIFGTVSACGALVTFFLPRDSRRP